MDALIRPPNLRNEFKSAIRFAEKGRVQYRELGKHEGEIACMCPGRSGEYAREPRVKGDG